MAKLSNCHQYVGVWLGEMLQAVLSHLLQTVLPKSVIFEMMHIVMKHLLGLVLFFPLVAVAQTSPEQIVKYKVNVVDKVAPEKSAQTFFISAPYGKPVLSSDRANAIKKQQIIAVELVYTKFRRSENFNQEKLNLNRLQNLQKIFPGLFADNHVDWKITEQTGATDYTTGQTYFHGFIVTVRKGEFSAKDREAELAEMEKVFKESGSSSTSDKDAGKKFRERNTHPSYDKSTVTYYNVGPRFSDDPCELMADAMEFIKFPMEAQARSISGKVRAEITVNKNGDVQEIKITEGPGYGCEDAVKNYLKTMPKWKPAKDKQGPTNAYVMLNFWFISDLRFLPSSEMPCDLIVITPKDVIPNIQATATSRVVSEIFDRHKNWNNIAVVCDVTGSMGPYMSDLMKWFRLNASRIKHFTFFNDGDMKSEAQKAVGNTGGIYNIPATNYENVEMEMFKAMRNGFGGDLPENDVEAVLEAEKNAPFAERIVWIADNYATPRDVSLLPKITKPVSIIVCSNSSAVSVDYLNIARKIKASLHTLTADFPDLSSMKDGEKITVDNREYQLVGEKFVRVY